MLIFPLCNAALCFLGISLCNLTDRCYKLRDGLSEFTEVQSILNCCGRNDDRSTSPCWAGKLLQREEKCVYCEQTRPTHACAHVQDLELYGLGRFPHSDTQTPACADSCGHGLTKTHASKHAPEKATANEPRRRPNRWHQSGILHQWAPGGRWVASVCRNKC